MSDQSVGASSSAPAADALSGDEDFEIADEPDTKRAVSDDEEEDFEIPDEPDD